MLSAHEAPELVAAGLLRTEKQLLALASRALDRVEEEQSGSWPDQKRRLENAGAVGPAIEDE